MTSQEEIDLAVEYGASYIADRNRGGNWKKFMLMGWYIWQSVSGGKIQWTVAQLHNHYYVNHCFAKTLQEALEFAMVSTLHQSFERARVTNEN